MKALVLHGFTGSLDTVARLKEPLEALGFEVCLPVLRGHWGGPENLYGVTWRDWVADARAALRELAPDPSERVLVAGLSMGALISCHLAAENPRQVHKLALMAPAFAFRSKLLPALPLIKRVRRDWPSAPTFFDKSLLAVNTNYASFPLEALDSVVRYVPVVESLVPYIECPVGIFFAKNDPTVSPSVPKKLETILGKDKVTQFSYDRTYHEMLQDVEADKVAADVVRYLCHDLPPSI